MSARSIHLVTAVAAAALAGCGSVKNMLTEVKDAQLACAKCQAGMAVAVGAPLKLKLDWKRCSDLDQHCQPDVPPFRVAIACEGAACSVEDTGNGDYLITPTAPGTSTIVVTMADEIERIERIGPFTAMPLDGIVMACTVTPAGGGREQAAPCGKGVAPGGELMLEIAARSGETWLANPLPRDVAVDGRLIYASGQMTRDAEWTCRASSDASDPKVPTVTRCRATARAGASWTVEARLPDQKLAARLDVHVTKR